MPTDTLDDTLLIVPISPRGSIFYTLADLTESYFVLETGLARNIVASSTTLCSS